MASLSGGEVGRLVGIWRFPVKSMAGESLPEAEVSWNGLAGDRRWAFIRPGIPRSGFSWLTIRERPELWRYRPSFADPARADASATIVRTPAGETLDVTDPALAAQLGEDLRIIKQDRGIFDASPLSLLTTQSLAGIDRLVDPGLTAQRFRPNLVVEATTAARFPEEEWVSCVLRIGTLRMRVDRRDPRCVVINVDPETGQRDPEVLRAVASHRANCVGVYGATVIPGRIALGDAVILDDR